MSSLVFLLIAVGLSAVGIVALLLVNRRPTGIDAGVEEFRREMRALAPELRRDVRVQPSPPRAGDDAGRAGG